MADREDAPPAGVEGDDAPHAGITVNDAPPVEAESEGAARDERMQAQKLVPPDEQDIQRVLDAVTGATWNTRNRIMEDLFEERRAANPDAVPIYRPPGTPPA